MSGGPGMRSGGAGRGAESGGDARSGGNTQSGGNVRPGPGVLVEGETVDDQTRCVHYRGPQDVVAIRFFCCGRWFPCLHCHEAAGHPIRPWPAGSAQEHAVLCGVCRSTLSLAEYTAAERCPHCAAEFNPGCALHHPVYFGSPLTSCRKPSPHPKPEQCPSVSACSRLAARGARRCGGRPPGGKGIALTCQPNDRWNKRRKPMIAVPDRLALLDLYARYNHAVDAYDADVVLALFAPGASFRIASSSVFLGEPRAFLGDAEVEAYYRGRRPDPAALRRHRSDSIWFEESEGGAIGHAALDVLSCSAEGVAIIAVGNYRDELVRHDGGWRFLSRTVWFDY